MAIPGRVEVDELRTMPSALRQLAGISLMSTLCATLPQSALAQSEVWLLGPNSRTGPESTVVPADCLENADGSITCNTKIENPAGDTPAKPYYNPFSSN